MTDNGRKIDLHYSQFYEQRKPERVYPTEFVVRIFLSTYPNLIFEKPKKGDKILDIGFGDGRNTLFLCDLGLDVYGVEITDTIVDLARARLNRLNCRASLHVGRNSSMPFSDNSFGYLLACHSCYYCDEGESFTDNLQEYFRILKPGGYLISSVPDAASYIFEGAEKLEDGSRRIVNDPYGNRLGYRLQAFENKKEILAAFSPFFCNYSFGYARNDYFGIDERVFWVVCQKINKNI